MEKCIAVLPLECAVRVFSVLLVYAMSEYSSNINTIVHAMCWLPTFFPRRFHVGQTSVCVGHTGFRRSTTSFLLLSCCCCVLALFAQQLNRFKSCFISSFSVHI